MTLDFLKFSLLFVLATSLSCVDGGGGGGEAADGATDSSTTSGGDDDGFEGGQTSTVITGTNIAAVDVDCTTERLSANSSSLICKLGEAGETTNLTSTFIPAASVDDAVTVVCGDILREAGAFETAPSCNLSEDRTACECSFAESNIAVKADLSITLSTANDSRTISIDDIAFQNECTGLDFPTATLYNDYGSGSAEDPYLLCNSAQVVDLAAKTQGSGHDAALDANFRIGQDLDTIGNTGIIGRPAKPFSGVFQGNGYKLANLNITNSGIGSSTALFAEADGATFDYFTIENANLTMDFHGAALVGVAKNGTYISRVTVNNLSVSTSFGYNVSGLVDRLQNSTVEDSHVRGFTASSSVYIISGFVNEVDTTSRISRSSVEMNVTEAPGFGSAGFAYYVDGTIEDSYVSGYMESTGAIGNNGLFAETIGTATLTRVHAALSTGYATGVPFYDDSTGGAVITSSVYDVQLPGTELTAAAGLMGATTAQAQTQSTYTGWDFTTIWEIAPGGYPRLRNSP